MSEASVIRWLLDGDPAIRWQVMRDLCDETEPVVAAERERVTSEGWGRALLDRQAPEDELEMGIGSYFGERCDCIVDRLLDEQLADGGWNCDAPPSTRSSFNSTIRVLEGLLEYERVWGNAGAVTAARAKAHEYLLERRMFKRLSSGEIIDRKWTRFTFPTMWHYDVLRGLEYLRSAGIEPDIRVAEAVGVVRKRVIRTAAGR